MEAAAPRRRGRGRWFAPRILLIGDQSDPFTFRLGLTRFRRLLRGRLLFGVRRRCWPGPLPVRTLQGLSDAAGACGAGPATSATTGGSLLLRRLREVAKCIERDRYADDCDNCCRRKRAERPPVDAKPRRTAYGRRFLDAVELPQGRVDRLLAGGGPRRRRVRQRKLIVAIDRHLRPFEKHLRQTHNHNRIRIEGPGGRRRQEGAHRRPQATNVRVAPSSGRSSPPAQARRTPTGSRTRPTRGTYSRSAARRRSSANPCDVRRGAAPRTRRLQWQTARLSAPLRSCAPRNACRSGSRSAGSCPTWAVCSGS